MLMGEYQDPLPSLQTPDYNSLSDTTFLNHLNFYIVVAIVTYFYGLNLVRHFNQWYIGDSVEYHR